jgi:hypothetical protein
MIDNIVIGTPLVSLEALGVDDSETLPSTKFKTKTVKYSFLLCLSKRDCFNLPAKYGR